MNISLKNWLRNKLQENEEMHDYAVATDTVRCWIDEYEQLTIPKVNNRRELLIAYELRRSSCTDEQAEIMVDSYLASTSN